MIGVISLRKSFIGCLILMLAFVSIRYSKSDQLKGWLDSDFDYQ